MSQRTEQVTDENLTLTLSSSSEGRGRKYFGLIPFDIIIKIFSRLPGKSMGKCRCVSKLWSSIIRSPNYNQLFPIKSPDPPKLFLFAVLDGEKMVYFSSPQPQNPDLSPHNRIFEKGFPEIFHPSHGLVCHQRREENYTVVVVFNPITGQSITTPKLTTENIMSKSYLGFDPIDKQFKVLSLTMMATVEKNIMFLEHQVLTLEFGERNLLWRKIECGNGRHYSYGYYDDGGGICINGVLYYRTSNDGMIVCFDVRSERFDYVEGKTSTMMVNYEGKLGTIDNRDYRDVVLWILEDAKEHKWSKYVFEKPFRWRQILKYISCGVTSRGELVLCPMYTAKKDRLDILYFSLIDTKVLVRVKVEVPSSVGGFMWHKVYIFPNYVEHVKLL